jgi:hypothetical protein
MKDLWQEYYHQEVVIQYPRAQIFAHSENKFHQSDSIDQVN